MAKLEQCSLCEGFVPNGKTVCPHCGRSTSPAPSSARSRLLWIGGALGGGAIAFTLMACYGMPPCKDGTRDCYKPDANGQSTPTPPANSATPAAAAPDGGK